MTLYLIRHADAGKRDPYSHDDHLRGLSEDGMRQAVRIADRLGDAGVTRVLSSPFPRCVQTVEPLARRLGVEVESQPVLAEGADGRRTFALMAALASTDAVLCSHGDVIPEVIRLLRITGTVINGERGNAKGSIWTIISDGESLLTAEYAKTPRKPDAVLH
ncbi:MAG: histidine phosphatase family protein [bacterium]|nr:histidine phosphatase family protein [bacterium]MCY3951473.1 histidine phosphatase family protein [bacterium]MCY4102377.1 histidine phosphatase family protein [bacterium]